MGGERRRREVWENQWAHCELRILKTKKIIVLVIVLVIVMQVYLLQTRGLGDGAGEGEAEGKVDCEGVFQYSKGSKHDDQKKVHYPPFMVHDWGEPGEKKWRENGEEGGE